MTVTLPKPAFFGSVSSRCVEDIMRPRQADYEHLFATGQEVIGHYYLAPFQRPAVWTETQSARLIESMHLGISIGSIVVSACGRARKTEVNGTTVTRYPDTADWLIDGQQRLRAIVAYLANDLTVFAGTEAEHRWSDLSLVQQRGFEGVTIGFITLDEMPKSELARVYDLLNFGGTAHTEDQRASSQITT